MIKRLKDRIRTKPDTVKLIIYIGLYFIYWFVMWILWTVLIMRESHNIGYYLYYGLCMSIGWLIFNKWNLIKSVFKRIK